ncbi:MAG TPA: 4Fe-4S binding protein [Rectinemataceae bacterium]|nr:4Fe-4S binding protein [Rectinemataceae bacterium]
MPWLSMLFAFLLFACAGFGASFLTGAWRRKRRMDAELFRLERMLPGYDCGLCGKIDCRTYAVSLLDHGTDPALCSPGGSALEAGLRSFLGDRQGDPRGTRLCAAVACGGVAEVAAAAYLYDGHKDCRSAAALYGGPKRCKDGCLGFGSCAAVCPHGAIRIESGCAIIDRELCTGCGLCVSICPVGVIRLLSVGQKWHVACASKREPELRFADCRAACTACGECVRRSFRSEFSMSQGLAVASERGSEASAEIAGACPTGAIVAVGHRKKR